MMDVAKYNLVEKGEYAKPKFWAKKRERNIYCYVEDTGNLTINAEFSDGKSMWVSVDTKATDLETNTAIFELILQTMDEDPSVWYASEFISVRTAIRLGADKIARACKLEAYLRGDSYIDFAGVSSSYTKDTPKKLAMQIFGMFNEDHTDVGSIEKRLLEIKQNLSSFSTTGNWQYNYNSISPYISELKEYKYLKIHANAKVRNLYFELEKEAEHLYNEYQRLVR